MVAPRAYHRLAVLDGARSYDMHAREDEQFYLREYLHFIEQRLPEGLIEILDLGCGQGRISLPLAALGHRVVGVDLSVEAISAARRYAREEPVPPTFRVGDILGYLQTQPSNSLDCVVSTEVLYMVPGYRAVVDHISRVLRPGGLAFLGFRTQFYYLLYFIQRGEFSNAARVAREQEGRLFGMEFNWHTAEQTAQLLTAAGFGAITCHGIGLFSGIADDPLERIARPSFLGAEERETLYQTELRLSGVYPSCGRYLLAIAEK